MAGWFTSRLGLSLAEVTRDDESLTATLYDGSRGVSLKLTPSTHQPGSLHEVKVRVADAEFVVQTHVESGHMHVREERPGDSNRRTVAQLPLDDASVLGDALDDASDLPIFIEAVQAALSLLRD